MSTIYPVILSGGSGTRLWPLSRSMYPKQFIEFFDDQGHSFLGATLKRLAHSDYVADPILLCNNDHRFLVREELERAQITARAIVLEPVARNTAAPITVAALMVARDDPRGCLVVMPSDHIIGDDQAFNDAVQRAASVASQGLLVLFGIPPNEPHTGYGYIHRGNVLKTRGGKAYEVSKFTEKPDLATATRYIKDGNYLWNSGIFVLNAKTFLEEIARFEPSILEAAKAALENAKDDLDFLRLDQQSFATSPKISVDYAVMERTDKAAVLPLDVSWSDIGSWSSMWDIAPHDKDGNFVHGDAVLEDTHDCYLYSQKALISTIGVKDLIVVDTPDALLVADKSRSQEVSRVVERLKQSDRKESEQHLRNVRPWGFFETLAISPRFQVKKLHVKPGGKLSLQRHHHRSEHWVVVQGTAHVTIGEVKKLVRENESVYIFATQWHRLENPGKVPLEIIEVQIGSYLGEDDIERSDDIYHRAPDESK